jgi:uncharacterized protein YegJ (DUF2314 family)
MSEAQSKVFMFDNSDPQMQRAYEKARATFRYFWREVAWERRRIVPALNLACVKAPFSDGAQAPPSKDAPQVEHMWMSDVDFDGKVVSGVLLNSPNWLKSVKEGDSVQLPLGTISDWMYAINGEVFGAYTVNLLRTRMDRQERQEHDAAWGLNFGDPATIRVAPEAKKTGGFLSKWFGKRQMDTQEHPMCESMAQKLKDQLARDRKLASAKDDRGWTFLHQEALAGNAATVAVLLDAGANLNALTNHGMTPLQLARALGWDHVVNLLQSRGATK